MPSSRSFRKWSLSTFALVAACAAPVASRAQATGGPDEKTEFLRLCDLAVPELNKEITPFVNHDDVDPKTHHVPFFEDSYAVRALAVAYDLTGRREYIEACQHWCDRVLTYQEQMIPKGAFYLNYGRRPGQDKGDWWVADSGSVGMGVLATEVRTRDPGLKRKYLDSLRTFARLVIDNYVKEDGGVTDGLWSVYEGSWWCSTATFGSVLHLLAIETNDAEYRRIAQRAFQWTIAHDFREATPISFHENPAGVVFYTFEFYAAAMPLVEPGTREHELATAQVAAAAQWWAENQRGRGGKSSLDYLRNATYMGGMPYLMYALARQLPPQRDLAKEADSELRYLAGLLLKNGDPPLSKIYAWELMTWTMVSYAEKLSPGALYRSSSERISPER